MAGEIGQLPAVAATNEVAPQAAPHIPAAATKAPEPSALKTSDHSQTAKYPTGPALAEVHFADVPRAAATDAAKTDDGPPESHGSELPHGHPNTDPSTGTTPQDPVAPTALDGAVEVVSEAQQAAMIAAIGHAKDEINQAMINMLDESIKSHQRMLEQNKEYHRKHDPIEHAVAEKHAQEAARQQANQAEQAQDAAEKRKL